MKDQNVGKTEQKLDGAEEPGTARLHSRYQKEDETESPFADQSSQPNKISMVEDPGALDRLKEDAIVRERIVQEMVRERSRTDGSIKQLFKQGVCTLGRSLKKASKGEDILDDEK